MRPWEETWRMNKLDGREVECPAPELDDDDAYRIAEAYMGSEDGTQARFDRAKFIAAAPDMARALRDALKYGGDALWMEDGKKAVLHDRIRAALIKAGVPIP